MTHSLLAAGGVLGVFGCGGDIGAGSGSPDGAVDVRTDAGVAADAAQEVCVAADLLIVLDRTGSMSQRPDGSMPPNTSQGVTETKWYGAVTALEIITAQFEERIRFGLALFPHDPDGQGGYDCSNLGTWLNHYLPPETDTPQCQAAEMSVSPALGTASAIGDAISIMDTGLCLYTPIGSGLSVARAELAAIAEPGRDQYATLVTDGHDNCDGVAGYTTDSLSSADGLAADGVVLHVIGFDGSGEGINVAHLNDLACAGMSAPDHASNCVDTGTGYRAVASPVPDRLFLLAEDGTGLVDTITQVVEVACCDCVD